MPSRAAAAILLALGASGLAAPLLRAQVVREKVSVEVLTVKLAARDRSGRSVDDLTRADLSLIVDGQPVAIDTLNPPPVSVRGEAAHSGTTSDPMVTAATPRERRVRTLIFLDETGTNGFDKRVVYDELIRLLRSEGAASARDVLVGRFAGSRLEVKCAWTAELDRAISTLGALRESLALNTIPSASELSGSGTSITWLQIYRDHFHQALLEALAAFPNDREDRQLVIVTGGTSVIRPLDLNAVLACQITPGERARLRLIDSDIGRAHARQIERATFAMWSRAVNPSGDVLTMSDVIAKALERDVALIPVNAEAIDRGLDLGFERSPDMRDLFSDRIPVATAGDGRLTENMRVGQTMTEIARSTGAEPILVPGKTGARLSEIGSRPTYSITFRDPAGDHRYHRIQLACRRTGVTLDYRKGYRTSTEDERMLDTVVARLADPEARDGENPLDARVRAASGERAALFAISFAPPRDSAPSEDRAVEIVGVGQNPGGERTEPVSWSGTARAAANEPGVYVVKTKLGVRAAGFRWSLAVRDAATGLTSYLFIPANR